METNYQNEDLLNIARKIPLAFKSALRRWNDKLGKIEATEFPAFFNQESRKVQFDLAINSTNKYLIDSKCSQENLKIIGYYSQFDVEEMSEDQIVQKISGHLF